MNEIEKMYENAGFETEIVPCYSLNCEYFEVDKGYPPFTAEKQIELIKFFAIKGDFDESVDIAKNTYDFWTMYFGGRRWTAKGFEETLAGLINSEWQDLTEEEKQQVKGILE